MGAANWAVDVTLANAVNGLDFGSHQSDGHVIESVFISTLPGTALYVGKSAAAGWVESVQGTVLPVRQKCATLLAIRTHNVARVEACPYV
jgi:hypothetical protein